MKGVLTNLNEALTYHLEAMYDAEKKLQKGISLFIPHVKSTALKSELKRYQQSAGDKRIKLKRVFSYLLAGPYRRKNDVVTEMLAQVKLVIRVAKAPHLRDMMMLAAIEEIIQYKVAAYRTALVLSDQMELNAVRDLLDEILQWEKESGNALNKMAITSVNRKAKDITLPAL